METSNEMLGKIMAIIMAVAQCAAPLGQALYGIAFQQFSAAVYALVVLQPIGRNAARFICTCNLGIKKK